MDRRLAWAAPLLAAAVVSGCSGATPFGSTPQTPSAVPTTAPPEQEGAPGSGPATPASPPPPPGTTAPAPPPSAPGQLAPGFLFVEQRQLSAAPPSAWTNDDFLTAGHVIAAGMTQDQVATACQVYATQSQVGLYDHLLPLAQAHELAQNVSPASLQAAMATVLLDECELRAQAALP
ncbi:MAG: hypothetical protein KDC39_04790 [Actinobacteria bacterium]|nr:hypothetical protein [Actinomycetota bacterium]